MANQSVSPKPIKRSGVGALPCVEFTFALAESVSPAGSGLIDVAGFEQFDDLVNTLFDFEIACVQRQICGGWGFIF